MMDTLESPHPTSLIADVDRAIEQGIDYLLGEQAADGHWCGELEGDSLLQSEYILLQGFLHGRDAKDLPLVGEMAETLLRQQERDGGWALFPGDETDVSASVKAYLALKIAGHSAETPQLRRAARAIAAAGGAVAVNSFTRFYLSLLGQIPHEQCPAVPPEAVLLPDWAPANIYRVSAWSRTILVPLSIVWAKRPRRELPAELGIAELLPRGRFRWPPIRRPGAKRRRAISWESAFRQLDRGLKLAERLRLLPLRGRGLRAAEQWMLERFAGSDGLGAIFPPIIWSRVALHSLDYSWESEPVRECDRQLDALVIRDRRGTRIQPCKSPVWDTVNSLRALAAAGLRADHPNVAAGVDWLLDRQILSVGDWSRSNATEPGGWAFEYNNAFYPDVDDTIMAIMAIRELRADAVGPRRSEAAEACERARRWVLSMQNRDGGWGAFDRDNDAEFLCEVPFADHNAMIDPSTPDIAARVAEALAKCAMNRDQQPLCAALDYVRRHQEPDGSWFGRWGVNYIYGTWQALVGLQEAGGGDDAETIRRGRRWLLDHQQPSGGWGESPASYRSPELRGAGPVTPSQTAWAVLGLLASGPAADAATMRGVQFLVRRQEGGQWEEPEFTGTGFPLVFYLRYHMYPIYFPLLALGRWRGAIRGQRQLPAARSSVLQSSERT